MYTFIPKLLKVPIITSSETITIQDLPYHPIIAVCPETQHDIEKVRKLGYNLPISMMNGEQRNNTEYLSWENGDTLKFPAMVDSILDNSTLERVSLGFTKNFTNLTPNKILYPKFGYCLEYTNEKLEDIFVGIIDIGEELVHVNVYITATETRTKFAYDFSSMRSSKIKIPTEKPMTQNFQIDVELHDDSKADENCDKNENYSYKICVNSELEEMLLPRYSCIPPFLSDSNQCSKIKYSQFTNSDIVRNYTTPYWTLTRLQAQKNCKTPCIYQRYLVTEGDTTQSYTNQTFIMLEFNSEVVKYTKLPNYDLFSFLVDIGGSLGLWLGFSALSIFDLLVDGGKRITKFLNSLPYNKEK